MLLLLRAELHQQNVILQITLSDVSMKADTRFWFLEHFRYQMVHLQYIAFRSCKYKVNIAFLWSLFLWKMKTSVFPLCAPVHLLLRYPLKFFLYKRYPYYVSEKKRIIKHDIVCKVIRKALNFSSVISFVFYLWNLNGTKASMTLFYFNNAATVNTCFWLVGSESIYHKLYG